ncbi:PGF-pre-PGF domain-containing protein [Halogranum gelatinilyticum]|uniref:PGF-pre-PGF domain-containing protein n=1 Tax=Halogranum gelatinilyticum TaxID=660521 RepID=A0A1G9X869_9EURY|nr:PGF-pre-PGF domain-containing protein [Halogranum gelatinilyticum]SDM92523.1 PGF-pre-PGF domain-containing protein [Halogranum gelatinilyticum]
MKQQSRRGIGVMLIVIALLLSTVAPVSGSLQSVETNGQAPQALDDSDFFSASDDVQVWDRSAFPLRVSTGNAANAITGPSIDVSTDEIDGASLNKRRVGVYNAGTTLRFSYQSGNIETSDFANADTQLLVARLDPQATTGMGLPDMDMTDLSELTTEDANDEASFALKSSPVSLDGDGENSGFSYTAEESGQYAFFLIQDVDNDNGISIDNVDRDGFGDLEVNNDVRVIGMDGALVQETSSRVRVQDARQRPGQSFTFNIQANLAGENDVRHSVVLYDEGKLQAQRFDITISGEIDRSITSDQVTVEHTVESVNGVANIPADLTDVSEFDDGTFSGTTQASDAIQFAADQANRQSPNTQATDDVVLDASVTAVEDDGSVTVTVETLNDWDTGSYRYIHMAVGDQTNEVSTNTGLVRLARGGGGGDDDNNDNNGNNGNNDAGSGGGGAGPVVDVEKRIKNGRLTISITRVSSGATVTEVVTGANVSNGVGLQQFSFSVSQNVSNAQVNVETLSERPSNVPDTGVPTAAYYDVQLSGFNDTSVSGGAFQFTVNESTLTQLNATSDQVRMYRFSGGEWQELETTYLGNGTYEAQTPGFSYFAVGAAPAQQSGQPNFNIESTSLGTESVAVDETVTVEASVSNNGDAAGTQTVTLTANGDVVDEQDVQLDAGESTTVTFDVSFGEAGTYDLAVNGNGAGSLEVVQQDTGTDEPGDQTSPSEVTPGEGDGDGGSGALVPVLVVFVLLALALVAYYFRDDLQQQLK